jgi:hypothetical protein
MRLTDDEAKAFMALYVKTSGKLITLDEAHAMGTRLLTLYELLLRPLPD